MLLNMNNNKVRKLAHLNKITEFKTQYTCVVMVSYTRLPNEQLQQFRDTMHSDETKILFIKNKIANLSFKNKDFEPSLENSNFLLFGNDIFSLLKSCNNFIKSLRLYPDAKLSIMAGFLENEFMNKDDIKSLEKIPSKEAVYVGILNTILYPMKTLVRLLDIHTKKDLTSSSE